MPDATPVAPAGRYAREGAAAMIGPVVSATVVFRPQAPARFARFPGSAWRGAFGHSLKRLVCVMHLRPCEGCALQRTCIFPQVFEPPVPAGVPILANYRVAPTALVLDPPETPRSGFYSPEETVPVTLRLFGRLTRFAPYVLQALLDAAARGVGPDRVALVPECLVSGLDPDPAAAPPFTAETSAAALAPMPLAVPARPARPVTVHFASPLRLRVRNDLVTPAHFLPTHLLRAALRRVSLVSLFFAEAPAAGLAPDFRALAAASESLAWQEGAFYWIETTRRSARQQSTMQIGGIIGRTVLDLSPAPELWPYLWLGQWLHLGKGTSMGFGRYRLTIPQ